MALERLQLVHLNAHRVGQVLQRLDGADELAHVQLGGEALGERQRALRGERLYVLGLSL